MIDKIKDWWLERQSKQIWKEMQKTMPVAPAPPQSFAFVSDRETDSSITITVDGEEVMRIKANGQVDWMKEDVYDEAAYVFVNSLHTVIEDSAGIIQTRKEWEERMTKAFVSEAENRGNLNAEELTNVVKKCIMYDRLKGTAT